ncbi:MAG TPA: CPBP family intramembrane glutamic endopeptidase [Candidatus Limnocylindrales bacterium]
MDKPRYGLEMLIVLFLGLGKSAFYSLLSIIEELTRPNQPLNQQTTSFNTSAVPDRPWLDLAYQVTYIVFPLVQVLLVLYLLHLTHGHARRLIGFDLQRPKFDLAWGFGIAAGIGIPGLGLYLGARALGLNTNVDPANLAANWWTVPVLVGLAAMNGILEEVTMLGYVLTRFADLGQRPWVAIVVSALIRGSYHLYQGFGGAVGNFIMGLAFGWLYKRFGRVMPLVIAHTILDIVSFVGYALAKPYLHWL